MGSELVKNFTGLDSKSSKEEIAAAQAKIMEKMDELRQALDQLA